MSNRIGLAAVSLVAVLILGACSESEAGPVNSGPDDLSVSSYGKDSATGGVWEDQGDGLWKLDMGFDELDGDDIFARCLPTNTLIVKAKDQRGGLAYVPNGCTDGHPS